MPITIEKYLELRVSPAEFERVQLFTERDTTQPDGIYTVKMDKDSIEFIHKFSQDDAEMELITLNDDDVLKLMALFKSWLLFKAKPDSHIKSHGMYRSVLKCVVSENDKLTTVSSQMLKQAETIVQFGRWVFSPGAFELLRKQQDVFRDVDITNPAKPTLFGHLIVVDYGMIGLYIELQSRIDDNRIAFFYSPFKKGKTIETDELHTTVIRGRKVTIPRGELRVVPIDCYGVAPTPKTMSETKSITDHIGNPFEPVKRIEVYTAFGQEFYEEVIDSGFDWRHY